MTSTRANSLVPRVGQGPVPRSQGLQSPNNIRRSILVCASIPSSTSSSRPFATLLFRHLHKSLLPSLHNPSPPSSQYVPSQDTSQSFSRVPAIGLSLPFPSTTLSSRTPLHHLPLVPSTNLTFSPLYDSSLPFPVFPTVHSITFFSCPARSPSRSFNNPSHPLLSPVGPDNIFLPFPPRPYLPTLHIPSLLPPL